MKINIVYEDPNLIVIKKPAGLVVHPGAGESGETLVDWLISKYPEIKNLDWPDPTRPGIVHRLDKDTSGLLIVAKNPKTLIELQKQFQDHKVEKKYLALVFGKLEKNVGEIESFIGRDPNARRQQSSSTLNFDFQPGTKRLSKTHYKVLKEYIFKKSILSLVEATLETGRTHQIRVHFKSLNHPVMGDQTYNNKLSRKLSKELNINRQFLHAYKLSFTNPSTNEKIDLESTIPDDLNSILKKLVIN